ncbi:MAG: hypothetical protein KBC50_03445 [Candidatus Pacebacteria bacterium]|jgi:hypothetical protein|nr:hypothetical protein [Candidatus Paceibacterota bacterium]
MKQTIRSAIAKLKLVVQKKNLSSKKAKIIYTVLFVFFSVSVALYVGTNFTKIIYKNDKVSITKTKAAELATSIKEECSTPDGNKKQDCYKFELRKAVRMYGLANGEAILLALQDTDDFAKSCHVIAHNMASEAYRRNPGDFYKLIESVNVNACGSGFLHGVLEAYATANPEIPIDGDFTNKICGQGNNEYRKRTCVHFVGHVFLINTFGNLEEALLLCKDLRQEWHFNCYDGIFMEDHQKLILAEHGMFPLPKLDKDYFNKIEGFCLKTEGVMAKACWTEMAEMYAHAYGYVPDIIFKNCSKAQTSEFDRDCYSKGVIAMAVYPGFDTPSKLTSLCAYYLQDMKLYDSCTQVLISSLIYNSPKFTPRGVTLCSSVPSSYANTCFNLVNDRLRAVVTNKKDRAQYCSYLPEVFRGVCLQ